MVMNIMIREQRDIAVNLKVISLVKKKIGIMSPEEMSDCFDVSVEVINVILDNIDVNEETLAEMLIGID